MEITSEIIRLALTECPADTTLAVWPLLPWIIGGAVALIAGVVIAICTDTTEVIGTSLAVLGMKGAGKTQLYYTLKQKEYTDVRQTSKEDYDSFVFAYSDKKIMVRPGKDIGGGEAFIKEYYEPMIKDNDIVFFIFDASRYIKDAAYALEVRARLDFVWRKMMDKYGKTHEDIMHHLVTIGSHLDKIDKKKHKNLLSVFQDGVAGKPYCKMFQENFILANLTEHDAFLQELIKKKIFG